MLSWIFPSFFSVQIVVPPPPGLLLCSMSRWQGLVACVLGFRWFLPLHPFPLLLSLHLVVDASNSPVILLFWSRLREENSMRHSLQAATRFDSSLSSYFPTVWTRIYTLEKNMGIACRRLNDVAPYREIQTLLDHCLRNKMHF